MTEDKVTCRVVATRRDDDHPGVRGSLPKLDQSRETFAIFKVGDHDQRDKELLAHCLRRRGSSGRHPRAKARRLQARWELNRALDMRGQALDAGRGGRRREETPCVRSLGHRAPLQGMSILLAGDPAC